MIALSFKHFGYQNKHLFGFQTGFENIAVINM